MGVKFSILKTVMALKALSIKRNLPVRCCRKVITYRRHQNDGGIIRRKQSVAFPTVKINISIPTRQLREAGAGERHLVLFLFLWSLCKCASEYTNCMRHLKIFKIFNLSNWYSAIHGLLSCRLIFERRTWYESVGAVALFKSTRNTMLATWCFCFINNW